MKTKSKKRKRSAPRVQSGVVAASLYGAAVGGVCSVVLLLVFSVICAFSKNPDALLSPLSLVASGVSFFLAGLAASKKKSAPLPCGALSGAVLLAAFYLISLFLQNTTAEPVSLTVSLLLRLACIFICIVGSLIGTNRKR